jgi:MFS family permease
MTGSAFLLGVVGFAGQIPTFLLAPIAGVLTDRWNRYRILLATQVLAMLQAFVLTFLYYTGRIQVWQIITLAAVLGLINAFDVPSRQSLVIEMVENKEDLGNAIALNSSMVNSARLIGPSLAGVLIAATGEGVCFLINGLSYIVVISSLLMMTLPQRKIQNAEKRMWHSFKEGVGYVSGFTPIRDVILLLALVSLVGMPYTVLMPVFAKEVLGGGSHTFGFLMGASGLGAMAGTIYLASRKNVLGLEKIITLSAAGFGLGLIAFSFSRSFILSIIFLMAAGSGMILEMASSNTITQTIVEDGMRGRVMSFYTMAFMGTAPFGSLLAGAMASRFGAPHTLAFGGVVCVIGAFVFSGRLAEFRKIAHPIYIKLGIIPEIAGGIRSATDLTSPPEG